MSWVHRERHRTAGRVAAVGLLALLALAGAAIVPGSPSSDRAQAFGQKRVATATPAADGLRIRETKVFGSSISAQSYGTEIARREQGIDAQGRLTSDLDPINPRAFKGPISVYRRYAERWAGELARTIGPLRGELRTGDRAAAERDWKTAFADYLRLGAVYGLLPSELNDRLAAVPRSLGQRRFAGLHRIEQGLWTGAPTRSLAPVATAMVVAVRQLRRTLPSVVISPLDYATRAHEILEDAQRDLLSGAQVPWSAAGVLGTAACLATTRKVIATLAPLLRGRENTLIETQNWLASLQQTIDAVRRRDGQWPSLTQLSRSQRERLDGSLAGTLGALSLVPATLETTAIPQTPKIPSR